jgi:hypothetical protein
MVTTNEPRADNATHRIKGGIPGHGRIGVGLQAIDINSFHEGNPMDEQQKEIARLQATTTVLIGFASALVKSLPENARVELREHFDAECESLSATMLADAGPDAELQYDLVQQIRDLLKPSFGGS